MVKRQRLGINSGGQKMHCRHYPWCIDCPQRSQSLRGQRSLGGGGVGETQDKSNHKRKKHMTTQGQKLKHARKNRKNREAREILTASGKYILGKFAKSCVCTCLSNNYMYPKFWF